MMTRSAEQRKKRTHKSLFLERKADTAATHSFFDTMNGKNHAQGEQKLHLGQRVSRFTIFPQTFAIGICALILLCLMLSIYPHTAAADEENLVNPQQLPDSSFIYDTSIEDLSTADAYYNNQTVQVVGEVIGDCIVADDDHCWITLLAQNPDSNATITLYMNVENAERIDTYGKYGSEGTILRVRGTYHLTCPDHEGLNDLHVEYLSIVTKGEQNPDDFVPMKFLPGAIAIAIGLVLLFVFYRIRESRR